MPQGVGKKHSEATKASMSEKKNKYPLGVGIYDLEDNLILKFNNNVELAKYLGISKVTVGKYLNSGLVYNKTYRFKPIQDQIWLFYFLESELVSGFMTEHAAVVFVFFFLAEYASIVLMCILTSILFLGGYLVLDIVYLLSYLDFII